MRDCLRRHRHATPDRPPRPKRGGSITIARIEDSQSFDKTNVFQNESIWITEQINETLYTAGDDGKTLKPWLATSYTKSPDGKTYTFTLRKGVKFSNGQADDLGGRQVLDRRRARAGQGLGLPRRGDQEHHDARPEQGRLPPQVQVGAVPRRHRALFANGIIPNHFAGQTRKAVLQAPDRHRPVHVGQRVVGQSVTFKRNPFYWQKGKPYLDSVTWTS